MAGRALLDTSAAAALLRGDVAVGEALEPLDEVYTSIVVIGELLYGARHSANAGSNLERVAAFAAAIVVLPADEDTADVYARIKQALRTKGRGLRALRSGNDVSAGSHCNGGGARSVSARSRIGRVRS